ncbi:methyltransferase family protein [Tunicatimonas pelagia]|uniref:methyltransferase family protein n=1 Tax=Tunicatimonas pelagia TaxID=931531 RepID=UPI0026655A6A|nr:isoprenylcysteine carboxylmethyltransferase family protein [Tunicatimonas pelagia]WKN42588.1 isoprenylcysteine carboxylmethyltransferase family protein [Tunicatimonas pelagia]
MVKFGNFLFRYRNSLFPVFYALLFIPSPPLTVHPWLAIGLGFMIALSGQTIRITTIGLQYIIRGGKNYKVYAEELVTGGLFSHCRNPLYVGNILMILGLGVMANSLIFVTVITPIFVLFYQAIVMAEEHFLAAKFGQAYQSYQQDVNRWLPALSGLGSTLRSMQFNGRRAVLKEYNTTYIWTAAAVLVTANTLYRSGGRPAVDTLLPYLITLFVLLTVSYATVRYLKKSKRLVEIPLNQ